MTAAADSPVNAATDLAEHLVEQGTPFREAHTVVGGARAAGGRTRRAARRARRRTIRASVPTACRCSNRAARCGGARRRAAADPNRSRASSKPRPTGSRSSGSGSSADTRRARSTTATRSWSRRSCSTRCWSRATVSRRASSRSRRTAAPTIPGSHAYRRRDAAQRDDVRPARARSTCTSRYGDALVHERGVRPGRRTPHAVLLRAAAPLAGLDVMRERRAKARRDRDLARGPGSLGQAFGVDRSLRRRRPRARPGPHRRRRRRRRPTNPGSPCASASARGRAKTLPYRFFVPGDPHVSRGTTGSGRGSSPRRAPSPRADGPSR